MRALQPQSKPTYVSKERLDSNLTLERFRAIDRMREALTTQMTRRSASGRLLSGGEQQMRAIGRALMTNPELLILDEATEGLAPLIRDQKPGYARSSH